MILSSKRDCQWVIRRWTYALCVAMLGHSVFPTISILAVTATDLSCQTTFNRPRESSIEWMQPPVHKRKARQCIACTSELSKEAVVLPIDTIGAEMLACTAPKTGSSSFRALMMHASGFWNYSKPFLDKPTPQSLAADVSRQSGYCWPGAKQPCLKDTPNADQLHKQFEHAFGDPFRKSEKVGVLQRSAQPVVPGTSSQLRAVQVRHPVARFVSGCTDKLLGRLGADAIESDSVVKWRDTAMRLLAQDLESPHRSGIEAHAWLAFGVAAPEWRDGKLKEVGWIPGIANQSYSQAAVGVSPGTTIGGVVGSLFAPRDEAELARSIDTATVSLLLPSPSPTPSTSPSASPSPSISSSPSTSTSTLPSASTSSTPSPSPLPSPLPPASPSPSNFRIALRGVATSGESRQGAEGQAERSQGDDAGERMHTGSGEHIPTTIRRRSLKEAGGSSLESGSGSGSKSSSDQTQGAINSTQIEWKYPEPGHLRAVARWMNTWHSPTVTADTELQLQRQQPRFPALHRYAIVAKRMMEKHGVAQQLLQIVVPDWLSNSQHYLAAHSPGKPRLMAHYLRTAMCGDWRRSVGVKQGNKAQETEVVASGFACQMRSLIDGFMGRLAKQSDVHFRLQRSVCKMDEVCYNHVVHLENYADDLAAVFAKVPSLNAKGYGDPATYRKHRKGPVTHSKHYCSVLRIVGQPWAQRLVAETWPDLQILGYGCDSLRWLWWSAKLAEVAGLLREEAGQAWTGFLSHKPIACDEITDDMKQLGIAAVLLQCGVEPDPTLRHRKQG